MRYQKEMGSISLQDLSIVLNCQTPPQKFIRAILAEVDDGKSKKKKKTIDIPKPISNRRDTLAIARAAMESRRNSSRGSFNLAKLSTGASVVSSGSSPAALIATGSVREMGVVSSASASELHQQQVLQQQMRHMISHQQNGSLESGSWHSGAISRGHSSSTSLPKHIGGKSVRIDFGSQLRGSDTKRVLS